MTADMSKKIIGWGLTWILIWKWGRGVGSAFKLPSLGLVMEGADQDKCNLIPHQGWL